ncbi:MAG: LacI family DNA-binding transcriptional regulator [Chthoniobacterales bacterium]
MSRSTVANILGGEKTSKYSNDTRRLVLKAVEDFGYRANRISRSVRTGRSNLIGVVHFNQAYEVARNMVGDISQAIDKKGYGILTEDLTWQGKSPMRAVEQLVEARVEGVVIVTTTTAFDSKPASLLTRAGIPAITLFGNEQLGFPSIYEDHRSAMRMMTEYVISCGHRHITLLISNYDFRPNLRNMEGFKDALSAAGGRLSRSQFKSSDRKTQAGKQKPVGYITRVEQGIDMQDIGQSPRTYMRELIKSNTLPDAIICASDQWALAVIGVALSAGLRVPEDLAVTGIDNETFASYPPYELTTMQKPIAEGCAKAADMIVEMIERKTSPKKDVMLPCKLVIRRSCGSPAIPRN